MATSAVEPGGVASDVGEHAGDDLLRPGLQRRRRDRPAQHVRAQGARPGRPTPAPEPRSTEELLVEVASSGSARTSVYVRS